MEPFLVPTKTRVECINELFNGEASKGEITDLSVKKHVGGMREAIGTHKKNRTPHVITDPMELLKRRTHANSETGSLVCLLCRDREAAEGGKQASSHPIWTKREGSKTRVKISIQLGYSPCGENPHPRIQKNWLHSGSDVSLH